MAASTESIRCTCPACMGQAIDDFPYSGDPVLALNADQRGGSASNGKPSLTNSAAGAQIGRLNLTWNGSTLGQPVEVTFAFRNSEPATMPNGTSGFSTFNADQIKQTLIALQSWSDVALITFKRIGGADGYSNDAQMLFGNYSSGASAATAFAYYPGSGVGGDSWYNITHSYNARPTSSNYGGQVLLHEIGHAIGLSHPGNYNAGNGTPTYANSATYYEDTRQYSVMSYWSETNSGGANKGFYAAAPLIDDIAAAQRLYGANMATRAGDTVYGFNSNTGRDYYTATAPTSPLIFAVWDAGGADTFDFSGYAQAQLIDLNDGNFSNVGGLTGNVAIAVGVRIENAIGGSGADTIIGNELANIIRGGAGNDMLIGGQGADALIGGDGIDTASYADNWGAVFVNLDIGRGYGNAAQGDTYDSIENVTGSMFDDFIIGTTGVNRLDGGAGDDVLIGSLGGDVLIGGAGSDTASYEDNWGAVFANLHTGRGHGNAAEGDTYEGIENLRGGVFDDWLLGNDGANRLEGGMGTDTLIGHGGADMFVFTHAAGATSAFGGANVDTIIDFASGVDKIELSASVFAGIAKGTLAAGAFVAGTAALDADDRILYDAATGRLFYDADGSGSGAAVLFAVLENKPALLAASDFVVT